MKSHCRIGAVRHKTAPHLLELRPATRGEEYRKPMQNALDVICDNHLNDSGLAGIVIVGWGFNGYYSSATRYHPDCFIGSKMAPDLVSTILKCNVIEDIAAEVYNGKL